MTTFLRQIYHTLECFSTRTQIEMCNDQLRRLVKGKSTKGNLVAYFVEAIESNKAFSQIEQGFDPEGRENADGTNPVATVMRKSSPMKVALTTGANYEFTFIEREIPHLRAMTKKEQNHKAWIDYVARTSTRPILGEIKWEDDENPFYAFIQLLTYLSEMATPNQIQRSIQHRLFGEGIEAISGFDLHIFLANFNDRGEKGNLIEPTFDLATAFKTRLNNDYPKFASCLGDILCLSASIDEKAECFSSQPTCRWAV